MKKKIIVWVFIIIMLLATLSVSLVACNKDDGSNNSSPTLTPGEALTEIMDKMINSNELKINQKIYGEFVIAFEKVGKAANGTAKLEIAMDIDTTEGSTNKDNQFLIELVGGSGNKLVGLYADGEYLYIDCADSHHKITNFKLKDMVTGNNTKKTELIGLLALAANLLFENVEVDKNNYKFNYDLNEIVDVLSGVFGIIISQNELDNIAKMEGYNNWSDLLADLNLGHGHIEFDFNEKDKLVGFNISNKSSDVENNMKMERMVLANGMLPVSVKDRLPENHANFNETKLLNLNMTGDLELTSKHGNIAKYTWELITNLDPLELLINRGDFNLDEDDTAHFILRNKTSDNMGAYNDSKLKAANGVILEVAYSPKEFGNKNVYICANLKSLISKSLLKEMGVPEFLSGVIPQYYTMFMDVDLISNIGNIGGQTPIKEKNMIKTKQTKGLSLTDLIYGISISQGELEIDRKIIDGLLGEKSGMLGHILDVEGAKTESVKLTTKYTKFGDKANGEYKMMDHFLYVADSESGAVKDFGETSGYKIAKDAKPIGESGYNKFSTIDGKIIHNNNGEVYKLSPLEANSIVGGQIYYNYTDFNDESANEVRTANILGISGLDLTKLGVEQEITLITSVTDGNTLLSLLNSLNMPINIPGNVFNTKILLSEESSYELLKTHSENYKIGDKFVADVTGAQLKITYNDGEQYIYDAKNIDYNIPTYNKALINYFAKAGEFEVKYIVAGREMIRSLIVSTPDRTEIILDNSIIGVKGGSVDKIYGKMNAYYGEEIRSIDIDKNMITFPVGAVEDGKFAVSGNYEINVDCFGISSKISVQVDPSTSVYNVNLSGDINRLNATITTKKVGDLPAGKAGIMISILKRVDRDWVKVENANINIDGKSIKDFNIMLPLITTEPLYFDIDIENVEEGEYRVEIGLISKINKYIAGNSILIN